MIEQYNAFIFDLDNTLIDENTYLFEAYQQIAAYTQWKYPQYTEQQLFDFLVTTYQREGREQLLDKLVAEFKISGTEMENLLTILRTVKLSNPLELLPEMQPLLARLLALHKKISIATNGNRIQQQNKIDQINWNGMDRAGIDVYFAADYQPKPSPEIVLAILANYQLPLREVLFIGDTETDRQCADNAGIDFCFISSLSSYLNN